MKLNILKISVSVLMMMVFLNVDGMLWQENIGGNWNFIKRTQFLDNLRKTNHPRLAEWEERFNRVQRQNVLSMGREVQRRKEEGQIRIQELTSLGGDASKLSNWVNRVETRSPFGNLSSNYYDLIWEADEEIDRLRREAEQRRQEEERLRREAEQRRQHEEARARQEAERRRQEEEARMRREAELRRQREETRAQQEAEVQLRMQELRDLGGDPSILSRFARGSGNPEEIREYKAALNRADAEIVRLRKEGNLNNQNVIDQLTEELESQKEENRELRRMLEQLMDEVKSLKMSK